MHKLTGRKRVLWFLSASVCSLLFAAGFYGLAARKRLDPANLPRYTVEELIDGLRSETKEGIGTHSTAWAAGFLAGDEEPRFRGGMLGSPRPEVSPVMRELVRRGMDALPGLVDHLGDRRTTGIVVKLPYAMFGGMWHSDEYDPRYADEGRWPPGVNTGREEDRHVVDGEYRVRVGDLCYVAIGQIVNRHLHVVRYQPTACIVINSPVETPALAAAVRADWGGLTPEEHERSLIEDAKGPSDRGASGALARLRFYYPEAAARLEPGP